MNKPTDWFTEERPSQAERQAQRKAANEKKTCSVPGCNRHRAGVSSMCDYHARRMRRDGDPVARQPLAVELDVIKETIRASLRKDNPVNKKLRHNETDHQARTLWKRPNGWAAGPHELHRKLTQKAKAEIIKAHLSKLEIPLEGLFEHTLAVLGWTAIYFDGLLKYRSRFIETQAGKWCSRRGKPKQSFILERVSEDKTQVVYGPNGPYHPVLHDIWVKRVRPYVSATVERLLGRDAVASTKAIYGSTFWDQEFQNTDRTNLQIAKDALKASGLLGNHE